MGESVPMLYFPLSKPEIRKIRRGGTVRKHWHLSGEIPTLLVVVATKKLPPGAFEQFRRMGISVTSIALNEEALQNIEQGAGTEAQYEHFKVLIGSVETFRRLGKMK